MEKTYRYNTPKVSAIVSTYNSEKYIFGCLDDLVNQSLFQKGVLEIIVIDSNSEQDEKSIVEEFQSKYRNIIYHRTKERETLYKAWNRGIEISNGKYITNANTDDRHRKDALEIMSRELDNDENISLVYGDILITENDNETFENNSAKTCYRLPECSFRQALTRQFFGPQPMWRKLVHEKIGYFNSEYVVDGDYDFFIRLVREFKGRRIPEFLGLYTKRQDSVERSNKELNQREGYKIVSYYRDNCELEKIYPTLINYPNDKVAYAAAWADIGKICISSKPNLELALKFLQKAVEYYNESSEILNNIGVLFWKIGQTESAVEIFKTISPVLTVAKENYDSAIKFIKENSNNIKMQLTDFEHPVIDELPPIMIGSLEFELGKNNAHQSLTKSNTQDQDAFLFLEKAKTAIENESYKELETYLINFRNSINYETIDRIDNRVKENPDLSVIIVAYNTNMELIESVKSLENQTHKNFEIIVVDNGKNDSIQKELLSYPILYLKSPFNLMPSEGRNLAVHFAKSNLLAFFEDDGIAHKDFTKNIIEAFNNSNIYALRGKVLPNTVSKNNKYAWHYNLGDKPIPFYLNTEGNSAFRKHIYEEIDGMNPFVFGYEGLELSYRMYEKYSDNFVYYIPGVIIYHDFAITKEKLKRKRERNEKMKKYLLHKYPVIFEFTKVFKELLPKSRLQYEEMHVDYYERGILSKNNNQPDEALIFINCALEIAPSFKDALIDKCKILQTKGETKKALSECEDYLSKYRDDKDVKEFVASLNNLTPSVEIVRAGSKELFNSEVLNINWVLTRKCNYTCSYCTVYDNKNGLFPPIENLMKAVDQISKLNRSKYIITLTGGEPTIHPKFTELLKYIVDNLREKVHVITITNLSRTSRFFNDLCENLKSYEEHLSFIASYHFEFAEKEKYLENAKILTQNGFRIHLSILAHPDRIELVKSLELELKKIKNGKLNYELIIVRQDYGTEPDKRYKKEDLQWLKEFYTDSKENKRILIDWQKDNNKVEREIFSGAELNAKGLNKFKGMICNAGKNILSINGNGDIDKAVCFRKTTGNKKNIYNKDDAIKESTKPVICPFERCSCIADLQIPKYLPGYENPNNDNSKKSEDDFNVLKQKLNLVGWSDKYEFYKKDFEYTECLKKVKKPDISIIVISWRLHHDTLKNFQVLEEERNQNFELIFVDNGGKENEFDSLKPYINTYIKLNRNTGAYIARNIGSIFSGSGKLLFLEDDGIPAENFVKAHLDIYEKYNVVALRGVYLPKTDNPTNKVQKHYELGSIPIPYYLNLEGNLSIKSIDFFNVGGFSDEIQYGYGGADLAYRLKANYPDTEPSWYFPQPKLYHDYTYNNVALENKIKVQENSLANLIKKYPGFDKFLEYYRLNHEIIEIEKNNKENNHAKNLENLLESYKIVKDELNTRLDKVDWKHKLNNYKEVFESVEYINKINSPKISIIVISWRLHRDTVKSFEILKKQRNTNFELIFVNNGADENEFISIKHLADIYVKLNKNTGAYLARNIGSLFANSSLLFFLEDDGIPENNLVEAHLNAHKNYDVIAVRGVYSPKTNNPLNQEQSHYYLGDKPFPIYADLEGNTSYKADLFYKVGGWDDEIKFGGGGVDLSIRLAEVEQDRRKQIYSPDPIIYHDFAKDENHLRNKTEKQEESRERLREKHPGWDDYIESWEVFNGKESTVIKKDAPLLVSANYKPLISICIPVYNQAELIKDAINSAINQSYDNTEIIIVDDGSEDNIKEVIDDFNSHKIKYYYKKHTNAADTRNRAVKEANGEFILWLDSDDILNENILKEYITLLNKNSDIDILYCSLQAMKTNGEIFYIYDYEDYYHNNDAMFRFLFKGQPIPNGGTLIRKKVYDEIGVYNTEFKRAHDYEFFSRLAKTKKYNAKYSNKVLYTYRVHEKNITLNSTGKINYENERKIFSSLISGNDYKQFFPDIDWKTNPFMAETVFKLKIGLRYYELEGFEEAASYLKQFFEIDKDEKNFLDVINRYVNDGNFTEAQKLINELKSLSNYFPNFSQIKEIIDNAVLEAEANNN